MSKKTKPTKTTGELISERHEERRLKMRKRAERMRLEDIQVELENKLSDIVSEFREIGIDDIEMAVYSDVGTINARYMDYIYRKEGLI